MSGATGALVVRVHPQGESSYVAILGDDWTPAEMALAQFGMYPGGSLRTATRHEILAYYPNLDVWTVGLNTPEDHPMWQED